MTLFEGDPYITGRRLGTWTSPMQTFMYYDDSPDPTRGWNRLYTPSDDVAEGRAVVVAPVGSFDRSVYVVGRTKVVGEGWQFATWRYEE